MQPQTLSLLDLLDALGYTADEHLSVCWRIPGSEFTSRVVTSRMLADGYALPDPADVWFGVNPVTGPAGRQGRGTVGDVTRLAALYADLDLKAGGFTDYDHVFTVVNELSGMLGTRPTAVTFSGHGVQPYWAIEHGWIGADTRPHYIALLRRFGRLVASVAEAHGAKVDSVYDLARVLRVPGTRNLKNPDQPAAVATMPGTGAPLEVDQVEEVLDAYGIPALDGDDEQLPTAVTDPTTWTYGTGTCAYARKTIAGWAKDTPDGRHPWLVAQAVRIAAMHANGCLAEADHPAAVTALADRFAQLVTHEPARPIARGEIADSIAWGRAKVATYNPDRLATELGRHPHLDAVPTATTTSELLGIATTSAPELAEIHVVDTPAAPPSSSPAAAATVPTLVDVNNPAATIARFGPTEDGTALAFAAMHGHQLRFCVQWDQWLRWDGTRWKRDTLKTVNELARDLARHIPTGTGWDSHKKRLMSSAGVTGLLRSAESDPRFICDAAMFDQQPYHLNTPSGVVDLRTGQLLPHTPDQLHTKITGVAYDPTAEAPRWQQFLNDTFGEDFDLIGYLQRLIGYGATGLTIYHVLAFLFGAGANGKTVFTLVLLAVLGEYAAAVPSRILMESRDSDETAIAQLAGIRLAICSEVSARARFDEEKAKLLTGGDVLTGRFLYQNPFTFIPTHTILMAGNHQPRVEAGGESFWRRLRLIGFNRTVPANKRIEGLAEQLIREEGPGILRWIIEGSVDVIANGLREPASVTNATAKYAKEENALAAFIEDCCRVGGSELVRVKTDVMRAAYDAWCHREGHRNPLNPQAFGRAITKDTGILGGEEMRSNGVRYYGNVSLVTHRDDEPETPHWTDR